MPDSGKARHDDWCAPPRDAIKPAGEGPMLERSALIGFVGVSDLDTARQFYGETLGLPIIEESPFALVASANGTMLRLTAVEHPMAAPYTILSVGSCRHRVNDRPAHRARGALHAVRGNGSGRARRVNSARRCEDRVVPRPRRQQLVPDGVRGIGVRKPRSRDASGPCVARPGPVRFGVDH